MADPFQHGARLGFVARREKARPFPERRVRGQAGEGLVEAYASGGFLIGGDPSRPNEGHDGHTKEERRPPDDPGGKTGGNRGADRGNQRPPAKGQDERGNETWNEDRPAVRRELWHGEQLESSHRGEAGGGNQQERGDRDRLRHGARDGRDQCQSQEQSPQEKDLGGGVGLRERVARRVAAAQVDERGELENPKEKGEQPEAGADEIYATRQMSGMGLRQLPRGWARPARVRRRHVASQRSIDLAHRLGGEKRAAQ